MVSNYEFDAARRAAVRRLEMTLKRQRESVLATEAQIRMFEELEKAHQVGPGGQGQAKPGK